MSVPATIDIRDILVATDFSRGSDHAVGARPTCLVCARPSDERICEACAARVRGQALERLVAEERAGGGGLAQ